jgi:hypothetical protein
LRTGSFPSIVSNADRDGFERLVLALLGLLEENPVHLRSTAAGDMVVAPDRYDGPSMTGTSGIAVTEAA